MNSCFYSVARVPRGPGGCSRTCERTCDVPPLSLGAAALCVAPLSPGWSGRDGVLRSRAPDTRGSGTALRRCKGHNTHTFFILLQIAVDATISVSFCAFTNSPLEFVSDPRIHLQYDVFLCDCVRSMDVL